MKTIEIRKMIRENYDESGREERVAYHSFENGRPAIVNHRDDRGFVTHCDINEGVVATIRVPDAATILPADPSSGREMALLSVPGISSLLTADDALSLAQEGRCGLRPDPTPAWMRLADLIELDARPLAQVAAAVEPPMSPAQLGQIKNGGRPNPSVETVGRILAALGRKWSDLDE